MPDLLVFPKFFQPLAVEDLAERMLECGFDGVDVIIREGYWCTDDNYPQTLAGFAGQLRRSGLKVYTATTNWTLHDMDRMEDAFRVFADNGIAMFRFWLCNYAGHQAYRAALLECRKALGRMEALGQRHGVKTLIQTHGGTMSWSPEAAYQLVHDLDPKAVGVHYDPGNMWTQEGWTEPAKTMDILGAHLAYVGVKNGGWFLAPDSKSDQKMTWKMEWTRLELGMVQWEPVVSELAKASFSGPYCMHNFYANTLAGLMEGTKADVQYFRCLLKNC